MREPLRKRSRLPSDFQIQRRKGVWYEEKAWGKKKKVLGRLSCTGARGERPGDLYQQRKRKNECRRRKRGSKESFPFIAFASSTFRSKSDSLSLFYGERKRKDKRQQLKKGQGEKRKGSPEASVVRRHAGWKKERRCLLLKRSGEKRKEEWAQL